LVDREFGIAAAEEEVGPLIHGELAQVRDEQADEQERDEERAELGQCSAAGEADEFVAEHRPDDRTDEYADEDRGRGDQYDRNRGPESNPSPLGHPPLAG